jgi:hypothetical protein
MIQRHATFACWMAYYAGIGADTPPEEAKLVLRQIALGRAWSFWPDDKAPPCALAGIVHFDESEVWLLCGSAAADHLLGLVRLFRRQVAEDRGLIGRQLVTRVSVNNQAGQRLVRLLGFADYGRREGNAMVWRLA